MFKNTCRTCLSNNGEMVDIFSEDLYVRQLRKKLMAFTKVEILDDDLLPKVICKKCMFLADSFYCFKEQCESADVRLKLLVQTWKRCDSSKLENKVDLGTLNPNGSEIFYESSDPRVINYADRPESSEEDYLVEYISEDVKTEVENAVKSRQETERKISLEKVSDTVRNLRGIEVLPITNIKDIRSGRSSVEKKEVVSFPVEARRKRCKAVETMVTEDPPPLNKRLRLPPETLLIKINRDREVKREDSVVYGNCKRLNFSTVKKIVKIDKELCIEPKEEGINEDLNINNYTDHDFTVRGQELKEIQELEAVNKYHDSDVVTKSTVGSIISDIDDFDQGFEDGSGHRVTPLALLSVNSSGDESRKIDWTIYEINDPEGFEGTTEANRYSKDPSPKNSSTKKSGAVNFKFYECTICSVNFVSMPEVLRHNVQEHMAEESPYVCLICDKSFEDKSAIFEHVEEHNGSKPYECLFCPKTFTLKGNLKRHLDHHTSYKPFQCRVCMKKFKKLSSLKSHAYLHTGDSPFACKTCNVSFNSKTNWRRHVITIHEKLKAVTCQFCNKELPDARALQVHSRVHTGDRPYRCPHCDKRFTQQCNLNTHIHCHLNDRPFVCPHCGKGFNQRGTRDDHILTHTGEKPHKCTECEAGFTVASALKRHMWIHTDKDRPYNCEKCKLRFVGLYDLRRHLKLRHGEIVKPGNPRVERVLLDKQNQKSEGAGGFCEPDNDQSSGVIGYSGNTEITAKENNSLSCNVDKFEDLQIVETEQIKVKNGENLPKKEFVNEPEI